ncbi:MAG: VIT domain-containing protein [Crocinitomicaceae bacterium]|nr:VIT domain-containing protein [Crocinitomicaceae bacterium]
MKNRIYLSLIFLAVMAIGIWWTIIPNKSVADPYRRLLTDHSKVTHLDNRAPLPSQIPSLKSKGEEKEQIQIHSLHITSYLENGFARTRYDLVFYNQFERVLESEFEFPVQDNQTITSFQLEVNGEMRPAVGVEKQQARIAYEATVRKGVDPGLLEKVSGNLFKMRVYPLLPKTTKRVTFEVSSVLPQDAHAAYFKLPLRHDQPVTSFSFKALTYRQGQVQVLKKLRSRKEVVRANIEIKQALNAATVVSGGLVGAHHYLHTNLVLPRKYARKKAPKCLTVCWDISASRKQAQLDKELALLESYLKWIKNGKLELICFAHQVLERKQMPIVNGKATALRRVLKQQHYDGATSLSCLSFGRFHGDEILLFSDGLHTLGEQVKSRGMAPIYPVVSSQLTDKGLLRQLAEESNGEMIDLNNQSVPNALKYLKRSYLQFLGFKEKNAALEYYCTPLSANSERIMLSIKAPLAIKQLTAQFGLSSKKVLAEQALVWDAKQLSKSAPAQAKRWALAKLQQLEEQPQVYQKEICALGLKYNLVSSASSLLVLDSLSDYLTYRITPPASMRKAYFKALSKVEYDQEKANKQHLKRIKKEWKAYQNWYWKKPKKQDRKEESNFAFGSVEVTDDLQEAPPPPPATAQVAQVTQNENVQVSLSTIGATSYNWSPSSTSTVQGFDALATTTGGTYHTLVAANANTTNTVGQVAAGPRIKVAGWNPKTPYLKSLRSVPTKHAYARYLELREKYASQPSFFIDVCDYFLQKKQPKVAVRILSNLAEMQLKDAALLRVFAQKLLQLKAEKLAIEVLKSVIDLRPEEPQSYRDYGLALAEIGKYKEAVQQLYKVVKKDYDGRFEGIHLIALNEINHLIAQHPKEIDTKAIPKDFLVQLPMDIRIVLNWDADNTDVDLWVTEPNEEKCMYSYKLTSNGGRISNDFTQGYGPEEYLIRKAPKGTYRIQAHYYGNHRPSLSGKAILTVQFYQNYGTPYEVKREVTRRLASVDEELDLATFEFD